MNISYIKCSLGILIDKEFAKFQLILKICTLPLVGGHTLAHLKAINPHNCVTLFDLIHLLCNIFYFLSRFSSNAINKVTLCTTTPTVLPKVNPCIYNFAYLR